MATPSPTILESVRRRLLLSLVSPKKVVRPERLVLTVTDQPADDLSDLVIVVLTDLGDGRTEMLFEQRGGHMSAKQYEAAKYGWGTFFDHMAAHLDGD